MTNAAGPENQVCVGRGVRRNRLASIGGIHPVILNRAKSEAK